MNAAHRTRLATPSWLWLPAAVWNSRTLPLEAGHLDAKLGRASSTYGTWKNLTFSDPVGGRRCNPVSGVRPPSGSELRFADQTVGAKRTYGYPLRPLRGQSECFRFHSQEDVGKDKVARLRLCCLRFPNSGESGYKSSSRRCSTLRGPAIPNASTLCGDGARPSFVLSLGLHRCVFAG